MPKPPDMISLQRWDQQMEAVKALGRYASPHGLGIDSYTNAMGKGRAGKELSSAIRKALGETDDPDAVKNFMEVLQKVTSQRVSDTREWNQRQCEGPLADAVLFANVLQPYGWI